MHHWAKGEVYDMDSFSAAIAVRNIAEKKVIEIKKSLQSPLWTLAKAEDKIATGFGFPSTEDLKAADINEME